MESKTTFQTATDGTTVTFDFAEGQNQQVTIDGNRTLAFSNPINGETYHIKIIQDATTGSRTVTWPGTVVWAGGSAPTLSTGTSDIDLFRFVYDGTSYHGETVGLNYS